MSFTPNTELTSDPVTILRCRQHAARIFADDQFRLLPKDKFLFHVSFNIDWDIVNPLPKTNVIPSLVETLKDEINLLVKGVDLPSYSVSSEVLNQYNRKKVVQFQHKYNDVGVTFHDDNMGLINQMWQLYYKYYYADPTVSAKDTAYIKNATLNANRITAPYGYNGRKKPFFKDIMIFQMSRKEFVSYKLINPIITSWTGGKVGYHEHTSHSVDLRLAYEAVWFNSGFVNHINDGHDAEMNNFGALSPLYDLTMSPLTNTDANRDVNTVGDSTHSFAKAYFGSTDPSVPSNLTNITDNVISKPASPSNKKLIYDSLLALQPKISGIQDVAMPIGTEDTNGANTATQANIQNTSDPASIAAANAAAANTAVAGNNVYTAGTVDTSLSPEYLQ
jgi:hypothetical protein